MPQGRKKVPFSGKAKRAQLKAKRQKKSGVTSNVARNDTDNDSEGSIPQHDRVMRLNAQPLLRGKAKSNPNRYALQFHRETDAEIQERKEAARREIVPVDEKHREIDIDAYFLPELDYPKRPPWNYSMSPAELDAQEHRYFTGYIAELEKKFNWKDLSYFELNLETWRQLWRVIEMSDVILIIVDIRYPALMFPPSLYKHVTEKLGKDMILVLNKIDLAPAPLVVAWRHYFLEKFPHLHVLMFTSLPGYNLKNREAPKKEGGLQRRQRRGKLRMAAEGALKLLEACKEIVKDQVDLSSWQTKISEEMDLEFEDDDTEVAETINLKSVDTTFHEHEKFRDGVLTIGCVGQPNAGKSSLMNAIMGKKVVSVSRTPGHTKYFQTIWLTKTVKLCDCPGLVFPSKVPKNLQILMGSFPIAQVREPYSAVQFLAERIDLPKYLKLQHPDGDDSWSAMDVCDGWAQSRGFYTAKAARLDTYRAANHLLRLALDGKICLNLYPTGFTDRKAFWASHSEVETVQWIQAREAQEPSSAVPNTEDFSDDEPPADGDEDAEDEEEGDADSSSNGSSSDDDGCLPSGSNKFAVLDVDD